MKMTKISATFTGTDGSMGFRTGQTYEHVVITTGAIRGFEFYITNDCTLEADIMYRIPYESIHAFLKNWTDINMIGVVINVPLYIEEGKFIHRIPKDT